MTPQLFFHNILIWLSKNAEYDADFKFFENSVKRTIFLQDPDQYWHPGYADPYPANQYQFQAHVIFTLS
jgi:hypothetical protein